MRVGTNRFINFNAAVRYYRDYAGNDPAESVRLAVQKIRDNEIDFGPPVIKDGESVILIDGNTRYAIETPEAES
jgi:hypothetical protein